MSNSRCNILLLDGDTRQSLPVAKALCLSGYNVTVVCSKRISYGSWSCYPHKKIYAPVEPSEIDNYFLFIKSVLQKRCYDVTIPLFDHSAYMLSKYKIELVQYTKVSVPDLEIFMCARDKKITMDACRRAGVPHPLTYSPDDVPISEIERSISFPCIIKPNISHGAIGIRLVEKAAKLSSVYNQVVEEFGPCCIQEYIPQNGMQYKVQVFRGSDDVIYGAVVFNKMRYFPITGGTSSLNSTVDRPDIIEICLRLLDEIKWNSHADVDLIEDVRDNTVKVMEINPRITGSIKIAFEAGVDFATMQVQHALNNRIPKFNDYKIGIFMRYLPLDILWFLYSPERFKSKPSWFHFFGANLCYQEGSRDDFLPAIAGFIEGLGKYLNPTFRRKKTSF